MGARVRISPLDTSGNLQIKPIARTSTLDLLRQYAIGMRAPKVGHLSVARRARELCGLCFASNASVRYRWFLSDRNPADEPSRRFEWTSQCHARFLET